MDRFPTLRRHSVSYGHRKLSSESESLLGGQTDELLEMEGLLKRGSSTSSLNRNKTMECDIQSSDTLLTLAFKYNVQVAELKRVNNILSDAEFFALKRIKIPVRPASLLTEILPGDPAELEVFENNNGWKVENEESPSKSLIDSLINLSFSASEHSSPGGSEADMEEPLSPHTREGNKQKKMVKKMLEEVDMDLDVIKIKQAELENGISEIETMEQTFSSSSVRSRLSGAVVDQDQKQSRFKLSCLCAFLLLSSLVMLGGLVLMVSIKHNGEEDAEEEEGDW
eukprot:GFUD01007459.1.p1 GENE.GFUD01007459.1~~GFUD01007459.1.p1  ORF type:complete len:301 (+),score=92.67 GFUD01007459.1:58-903(+)